MKNNTPAVSIILGILNVICTFIKCAVVFAIAALLILMLYIVVLDYLDLLDPVQEIVLNYIAGGME